MAIAESKRSRAVVILLEEGSGTTVTFDPQNRDKFCMEVDQVVKACQLFQADYEFYQQLKELQQFLADWVSQQKERLSGAYIAFRPTGDLLFAAAQKEVVRDDELVDLLTDLDLKVASDSQFDQLKLEVLQLPKTSRKALDAFLFSGKVFEHAGNGSASTSCD